MGYFENNRLVNFEDLDKVMNEEGKKVYSLKLIQGIRNGNYNVLNEINPEDKNDKKFMEPLLYAVKNEKATYIVYKYYEEELQKSDLTIATEIVANEPYIMEDTAITNNPALVLHFAKINPKIILYISEELKNDGEFIEKLCEIGDKDAITYAIRECNISTVIQDNPELASNPTFMKEAVKENADALKYADENLKNDYKFMKEVTQINYEAVGQVIKNREAFGVEGIKGAKETTRELTQKEYMQIIDDMSEHSEDYRYVKVKEKIAENGINNPMAVKWITAMVAQNKDNVSTENFQKVFDYSILTMIKIQKDLTEDGNIKVTKENTAELIRPQILNKLREAAAEKGLKISEGQEKLFKEYEEFHEKYMEKLSEQKKQNLKNNNNLVITPKQIENKTVDIRTSEINGQTQEIREEYVTQTKEKREVGIENEYARKEARE